MTKVCSRCRINKPLAEFQRDPRYRFGVHGWCKLCRRETKQASDKRLACLPKIVPPHKTCRVCHTEQPITNFSRAARAKDGHSARCKGCYNTVATTDRATNPSHTIAKGLRERFNMSTNDVESLFDEQGGVCAVCRDQIVRFCIDHDHSTFVVRGLLCYSCNFRLGAIEDAEFVKMACAYLARTASQQPRFFANSAYWNRAKSRRKRRA